MNKNVARFSQKQSILILAIAVVLVAVAVTIAALTNKSDITSFQECTDAGYAVALSYPETCSVPDGKTFVSN